jgi:hypothetical protein
MFCEVIFEYSSHENFSVQAEFLSCQSYSISLFVCPPSASKEILKLSITPTHQKITVLHKVYIWGYVEGGGDNF